MFLFEEVVKLKKRVDLLEAIISSLQLRLGFAAEPHKDQTYGPERLEDMIKSARSRRRKSG